MQHNQAKVTKKTTLQLQCKECKHSLMREGLRLKKAELE
jgi:ribosomal protein L44E